MNLTQRELGERCGRDATTISHIERGREHPSIEVFAHLVRELKVPAAKLLAILDVLNKPPGPRVASTDSVTDLRKERERRKN